MTTEQAPQFSGDEEIESLLASEADPIPEFQRMVEEDEQRTLWLLGRALSRLAVQDEDMARYLRMIAAEVADERAGLQKRMASIESIFEGRALYQREALNLKSLKVPGIGEWKTRAVPASWRTEDEKAAIEALRADSPDEFQRLTHEERIERLDKDELKAWLDELGVSEYPGLVRTPEHVSVKSPYGAQS